MYFIQYDNLWVHSCCCKWHFFNGCVIFFFIHFSVDGHLGCFHVLATVNSAAVNTGMHISFQAMFFSIYLLRSGTVRSYRGFIFSFLKGNSILFFTVAEPIHIPTNNVGQFPSRRCLIDAKKILFFIVEQVFLLMGKWGWCCLIHTRNTQWGKREGQKADKFFFFTFFLSCYKIWILFQKYILVKL